MGEVVAFSKGSGYSKSDLKDSGIPVILYGRLYTNYETVIKEVDTFADSIGGAVYSKGGEIITPSSGETSEDISIASVVEKSGILLGGDLNIIYPQNFLDSIFIAISISNGKPHKDMAKRAQGKSVVHLHNGDLAQIEIDYPSIDEQTRISSYFHSLDHLITLHQSKSFESFFVDAACCTLSWEQRKLGELATYFEYGLNVAAKEYDGENKYIRITDIDDESHEFRQDNLTSPDTDLSVFDKYKLSDGDLLLSRTGASVGKSYIYKASDGLVYYAGFLIRARIKEENNSEFVYQNTLTSKYVNFIKVTSMRSGQPGVNAQEYSQFEIMIPSKAEQDTITYYFSNLDHLITLHQLEPYYQIFKAIAYRIIDYAEYKFFNVKINLIYDIIRINIA